jgi:hypothetical protein
MAAFVALFGERLRARWFKPELRLALSNETGYRTPTQLFDENGKPLRITESHWYHVMVTNVGRASAAHETRVVLLQADVLDASGQPTSSWSGAIPLRWRDLPDPSPKTVGPPVEANLCKVLKDKWIALDLIVLPAAFAWRSEEAVRWQLALQAQSVEVESPVLVVEITWHGDWVEDKTQMKKQVGIKIITPGSG